MSASVTTGGARVKLALLLPVAGLFLILVMLTRYQPLAADITPDEARLMWIVRDVVEIQPAPPREFARNVRENLTSVLDRSRATGTFPLYPLMLEGWTWLVGDSVEMARVLTVLVLLLDLVLIYRLVRRLRPDLALPLMVGVGIAFVLVNGTAAGNGLATMLVGFLPVLIVLPYFLGKARLQPTIRGQVRWLTISTIVVIALLLASSLMGGARRGWRSTLDPYLANRNPLHPALTAFAPGSVIEYYDDRFGLRRGVAVDLAWREFSQDEVNAVVEKIIPGKTPIWVIMPVDDPMTEQIISLLDEAYTTGYSDQLNGIAFYRFDPAISTD